MKSSKQVVIVGAGPAGMMLAYQLASSGVQVRVLERHPDFRREFRGELMQRSVVEQLQKAGIFKVLLDRGLALPDMKREMFVGTTRKVRIPGPVEVGAVVNQPGFLELLHELCSELPNYHLDFGTAALEAIREGDKVVAMKTRRSGSDGRVDGDLFIICNGRNSPLRKSCGLETELFPSTADALWLRFDLSDAAASIPSTVEVHMFGNSVVVALQPASGKRLHAAYSSAEDLNALKKNLPQLRTRLLAPGGAVLGPLMAAKLDAALLQKIQDERQPEIEVLQAGQTRAGAMAMKPGFVLHLMFTMMGMMMALMPGKLGKGHGIAPPGPRFLEACRESVAVKLMTRSEEIPNGY